MEEITVCINGEEKKEGKKGKEGGRKEGRKESMPPEEAPFPEVPQLRLGGAPVEIMLSWNP